MAQPQGQAPPPPPRIPESWLSAAEQRFYVAAVAGGLQVYKLSDALFHFYRTTLSTSVAPTPSTFLSPIAIINSFLPFNLANWLPFISLDASAASTYLTKWVFWDCLLIVLVLWLRVPGLRFGPVKGLVYAVLFTFFDALIFGTLGVWAQGANLLVLFGKVITNTRGQVTTLGNKAAKPWKVVDQEQHLLGHRSIRVLPHGTALFNPASATYCLPPGNSKVLIPVITNNSEPHMLWYSVQSLDDPEAAPEEKQLEAKHLERGDRRLLDQRNGMNGEDADDYYLDGRNAHAGQQRAQQHAPSPPPSVRAIGSTAGQAAGDGYGAITTGYHGRSVKPDDKVSSLPRTIEPSQTIYYLPITQPGWIQLERVQDADQSDFRIRKTSRQALVVECPSEGRLLGLENDGGVKEEGKRGKGYRMPLIKRDASTAKRTATATIHHRCVGDDDSVKFRVRGVGELQVGWLMREGKGKDRKVIEEGVIRGIQAVDPFFASSAGHQRRPLLVKDRPERVSETTAAADERQVALRTGERVLTGERNNVPINAAAQTHDVFLPVHHRQPGLYEVEFLNVTDQFGNFKRPDHIQSMMFEVHPLPVVSFTNHCAQPRTLRLLQNNTVSLPIIMPGARVAPDGTTRVKLSYRTSGDADAKTIWEKEYDMEGKSLAVPVDQPGVYSIEGAHSPYCRGLVNEPATCVVEAVPVPKAEVKMDSLSNECAGDTGVRGTIEFIGTPPFRATYKIESGNRHIATKHVNSNSVIAHFTETPSSPGQYTYTMLGISDKHYQDIPIKVEPFKQTVHPLPKLSVSNRGSRRPIWSCATNQTTADFTLSGMGPFTVDYTVSWPMGSYASQATFNKPGSQQIALEVPTAVAATGGIFTVTFTNIRDANGCLARTNDQSVSFDVKTTRPTAKFGDTGNKRVIQVVEGSSARAVIRLTGEGPWTVGYVHSDNPKKIISYNVDTANAPLTMDRKGVYRLVTVSDAHCPGHIVEESGTFELTFYDKPTVQLPAEWAQQKQGQVYKRSPICAGAEDHVTFNLEGQRPFQVRYRHDHTLPDKTKYTEERDIVSAQETGLLHMDSQPGQHKYTVLGVKDVAYDFDTKTLKSSKGMFNIEQEVFGKPRAGFLAPSRFSYCVGQSFKASYENSATIEFAGKAPFEVDLALGPPGSRPVYKQTIKNIKGNSWKVDLPEHTFSHVGSQLLTIVSVRDSSGCPAEILNDDSLYLGIDVLETATITPVNERLDYCVGDMLEFVLGGTAPWHVAYKFNKKTHDVVVNTPQFYRLAERAGDLEIKSVSNKNNKCSTSVEDIRRKIHPLPKAKIEEGKPWLHEGDETEITFSFKGTPPFTFTYTRSISDGRKGSKVMDTQTISDIQSTTYTFSTAMEGEYDVTYVKDAYCSYPPKPRSAESKQKLLQL